MKRFVALILSIALLMSSVFTLSGCSERSNLTMGTWLSYIAEYFGMESYTSEEPYFEKVNKDNEFFGCFQLAAEWGIVAPDDGISPSDVVTWEDALLSLVNAGEFLNEDASDEMKIDFAIKEIDSSIRTYWMDRNIDEDEAIIVLAKAQDLWANKKYTENIEEYEYNDNIVDLTENDVKYINEGNTLTVDDSTDIEVGDICVVSVADNELEKEFKKVVRVENNNNVIKANLSDDVELEDVYEELYIKETLVPNAENTIIYDGNGNQLKGDISVQSKDDFDDIKVSELLGTKDIEREALECVSGSFSNTFSTDGLKVTLSAQVGDSTSLSAAVKGSDLFGVKGLSVDQSFEVSDISVSTDFDWGFLKLKSASLRIDYKTKNTTGLKYSSKAKWLAVPGTEQKDGSWRYNNGNGKFLTNLKKALKSPMKAEGTSGGNTIASKKQIKICSLNIYSVGVAKICLDVNLEIAFDGSITITVTESGSKGVEYKNGNIRFIKTSTRNVEAQAKAKLEVTIGVGPALYAIGLKKKLVGLEVRFGAGISASLKAHLADSQMHLIEELDFDAGAEDIEASGTLNIATTGADMQAIAEAKGGIYNAEADAEVKLHIDWCLNLNVYGIVKIGLSDEAYLADLIGGKASLTVDILNEKNGTFFNFHVDNFKFSEGVTAFGSNATKNNCTLQYVPFDSPTDEEEETEETLNEDDNNSVSVGEKMALSTMNISMQEGQSQVVEVTKLPEGYALQDVAFSVKDKNIATVDANGKITAIAEGCTIVYAQTKDKKHTAMVSVIVVTENRVEYEGLKSNVKNHWFSGEAIA